MRVTLGPGLQDEIAATGWLDTGDLGYLLDGFMYVSGGIIDMIIVFITLMYDIEFFDVLLEQEINFGDAIGFVLVQER